MAGVKRSESDGAADKPVDITKLSYSDGYDSWLNHKKHKIDSFTILQYARFTAIIWILQTIIISGKHQYGLFLLFTLITVAVIAGSKIFHSILISVCLSLISSVLSLVIYYLHR